MTFLLSPGPNLLSRFNKAYLCVTNGPEGLGSSLQSSLFDAGCLPIQSKRNVYSLIAQVNPAEGKQSDFSFSLLLLKNMVISLSAELYCYYSPFIFAPCQFSRRKRHTIHSSPNEQDCSLFNLCMQSVSLEIFQTEGSANLKTTGNCRQWEFLVKAPLKNIH